MCLKGVETGTFITFKQHMRGAQWDELAISFSVGTDTIGFLVSETPMILRIH